MGKQHKVCSASVYVYKKIEFSFYSVNVKCKNLCIVNQSGIINGMTF